MKKHRWTIVFTACLLAFTVFLAMDTFVLPSVYQTEAIEMNMNMFSQAEGGSNTSGKDQTNEEDGEKGKTSKSKVTGESDETEGSENTEETKESGNTEETKESGNAEGAKESGNTEETDDPGNADETVETETAKGTEEQGETEESSKPASGTGGHRKKPDGSSAGKPGRSSSSESGGSSKGKSGSASKSSSFDEEEALESAAAVTTDNAGNSDSYEDENIKVTYTQYTTNGTTIHVADVQLSSAEYLKTAFAQDTYGKNVTEATSSIAEAHDAVLAINGDYYGVQEKGYVIRNGVVYRDKAGDSEVLCIYADGSMKIVDPSSVTAQELVDQGVWQAFSFGPGLVEDGEISVSLDSEVGRAKASNPRTAIGIIDDLHYVFVVSDGRTDDSEGVSLYELASFMEQLGVQTAYNLDGGGSSTMVFRNQIINNPTGGFGNREREVSDIVYIGKNEIIHYADSMLHDAFIFLAAGILSAVFGLIYEIFSHEVYSFYMIYAFLILLVPGALLNLLIVWLAVRKEKELRYGVEAEETAGFFFPGRFTRYAWNSGLAALTTGAIFKGVLDIYGTTNKLIAVYPAAGTILIGAAVLSFCMSYAAVRKMRKTQTA